MSAQTSHRRSLRRWPWLELALILSLCSLALQIFGPTLGRWWYSPSPGAMGVDYLGTEFDGTCLSQAFVGYLPKSYRQQTAWPLVLYLHGSGGRGFDPEKLLHIAQVLTDSRGAKHPAVLLLPQCRPQCSWRADDICKLVSDAGQRYRIDPTRVYLIGNSMGGFGAWEATTACPELFAAIVSIAGGGSPTNALTLANVPTWAFHGTKDDIVLPEQSTKLVEAIRAVGGSPRLTLYPEAGHGIRDRVLHTSELWAWLFQQSLGNRPQPIVMPTEPCEEQ